MNNNLGQQRFSQRGFNLIEVMVAVTVLGILVALAAPAFNTFIADQRVNASAREMLRNIQYARSEAISRNTVINMQRTSGTGRLWEAGWTIFTDADRAGNGAIAAGDTLLRTVGAQAGGITLRSGNAANNWLSFAPDGTLNEGASTSAIYVICDDRGAANGRTININAIGRARLENANFVTLTCTP